MELYEAFSFVLTTISGLVCVYSFMSAYLLYSSKIYVSKGEDFGKLINSLFLTVFVGFVFSLWNLFTLVGIIPSYNKVVIGFISISLIIVFFAVLTYMSFLTRQFCERYGFKMVNKEIVQSLKLKSKPVRKPKRGKR